MSGGIPAANAGRPRWRGAPVCGAVGQVYVPEVFEVPEGARTPGVGAAGCPASASDMPDSAHPPLSHHIRINAAGPAGLTRGEEVGVAGGRRRRCGGLPVSGSEEVARLQVLKLDGPVLDRQPELVEHVVARICGDQQLRRELEDSGGVATLPAEHNVTVDGLRAAIEELRVAVDELRLATSGTSPRARSNA